MNVLPPAARFPLDHPMSFRYSFYGTKKEKEQPLPQFVLSLTYQCACHIRDRVPLVRLRHHRHRL